MNKVNFYSEHRTFKLKVAQFKVNFRFPQNRFIKNEIDDNYSDIQVYILKHYALSIWLPVFY